MKILNKSGLGGYMTYTVACPYCETECHADWVDVGVGNVQCGPFHCDNCGASEMGPGADEVETTPEEDRVGWYGPGKPVDPTANTCNGQLVDHKTAKKLYDMGLLDEKD